MNYELLYLIIYTYIYKVVNSKIIDVGPVPKKRKVAFNAT